jgi:hypothetical protein
MFHARIGEQIRYFAMARAAGIGDRIDSRRHGAMIAMAIVAGRRAQIPLFHKCPSMNST